MSLVRTSPPCKPPLNSLAQKDTRKAHASPSADGTLTNLINTNYLTLQTYLSEALSKELYAFRIAVMLSVPCQFPPNISSFIGNAISNMIWQTMPQELYLES